MSADQRPEIIEAFHDTPFSTPVLGVTGGKKVALMDADVDAPNLWILCLERGT